MSSVFLTFSTRLIIATLVMATVFIGCTSDYAESSKAIDDTQVHQIALEERLRLERQYGLEPPNGSSTKEHDVSGGDIGFSIKGLEGGQGRGSYELVASVLGLVRLLILM